MSYADGSLRSEKNVKPLSLRTERLQRIGKEPVFKGCMCRDHNWVRPCSVWEMYLLGRLSYSKPEWMVRCHTASLSRRLDGS